MDYRIIVDSCGELTEEMKESGIYETAPLSMEVGGVTVIDDETFDQADFLRRAAASPECPKSSCPSPEKYMELYCCSAERVYAVTLSSELSGSYNSAELGKKLYEEEHGDKKIYVLQHTYFVLENLDTLRKNGRLTGIKSFVASALNIKPVMGSTPKGTICQLGQARGVKRALVKMADCIQKDAVDPSQKVLAVAHCNCPERAKEVKDLLLERLKVKSSFIVDTAGISTMYANDGGIIVVL